MTRFQVVLAVTAVLVYAVAYTTYFNGDLRPWRGRRGRRRRELAEQAAREQKMKDELARRYLNKSPSDPGASA